MTIVWPVLVSALRIVTTTLVRSSMSGVFSSDVTAGPSPAVRVTGMPCYYCAAARIGTFAFRKLRTRLIVRSFRSGGSRQG
jgi:hypothetical protein